MTEAETENSPIEEKSKCGLSSLAVMIGKKRLNFKIVDKKDCEEYDFETNNALSDLNYSLAPKDAPSAPKRGRKKCTSTYSNTYNKPGPPPPGSSQTQPSTSTTGSGSGGRQTWPRRSRGGAVGMRRDFGSALLGADDAEFNCMFCGCCFESADDLTEHEPLCAAGETDSMNISCHCGRTFVSIDALDSHCKTHEMGVQSDSANFHCRYCGKEFGTALSLATHEAVHSQSMKPFRCNFCNKAFLKKMELLIHEQTHVGETPFSCSYCDKTFPSRMKLSRHEIQHTGQKPFTCNYCGKTFTHQQSLQKHERAHTGEKPFQCPICTKCFAAQSNYDVHMKLHASGRRFFCSFCGKWFRTEHQMLEHQQNCLAHLHGQNTGDGKMLRYQCSYCEKMFHYRRDQLIHERTHTGERPYTCGYCSKGFTQSQALTIHIRTHTGERPYMCELCGCDFRDSSSLRKHEFIRHPNIAPNFAGNSLRQVILTTAPEEDDAGLDLQMDF